MLALYFRASDALTRWFLAASNVLLLLMLALIGIEVTLRNVFGVSTKVADEYSGYLFCWLTLLGFVYVARNDGFIRVEFVMNRVSGRAKEALVILGCLCGLALCAIVCYATLRMVLTSWQFHSASAQYSQTPLAVPQAMMPVAFFLLAVIYAVELCAGVGRFTGRLPSLPRERAQ